MVQRVNMGGCASSEAECKVAIGILIFYWCWSIKTECLQFVSI